MTSKTVGGKPEVKAGVVTTTINKPRTLSEKELKRFKENEAAAKKATS